MKLVRMIKYDIDEGLIKYWYKWIFIIIFQFVNCCLAYRGTAFLREMYESGISFFDISVWNSLGRFPYNFDVAVMDRFTLPFIWIIQYVVLAYIIGGYIKDDIKGYGVHLILKNGNRGLWWLSKVIWCAVVTVIYFGINWLVNIAFSWVMSGNGFKELDWYVIANINSLFSDQNLKVLVIVVFIIPVMAGIILSLLQMVMSLFFNEEIAMIIVGFMLVLTSYYSHPLIPFGYSMSLRYCPNSLNTNFTPLNLESGVIYMLGIFIILYLTGLCYIKKKDIIW